MTRAVWALVAALVAVLALAGTGLAQEEARGPVDLWNRFPVTEPVTPIPTAPEVVPTMTTTAPPAAAAPAGGGSGIGAPLAWTIGAGLIALLAVAAIPATRRRRVRPPPTRAEVASRAEVAIGRRQHAATRSAPAAAVAPPHRAPRRSSRARRFTRDHMVEIVVIVLGLAAEFVVVVMVLARRG